MIQEQSCFGIIGSLRALIKSPMLGKTFHHHNLKETKMEALMVIALMCQVHGGVLWLDRVDSFQKKCQKDLIACYEAKFPVQPADPNKWVGGLKDCLKAR